MDLIGKFKKEFKEKYDIDKDLYKAYEEALEEYEAARNKYTDTLNDLKEKSFELWRKAEKVKKEKLEFEKDLEFKKADEKELELEQINKDINKAKEREEMVEKIIKDNAGEITEKANKLMRVVEDLHSDTHNKLCTANCEFRSELMEYDRKVQEEILKILFPLDEMLSEYNRLRFKIRGY